MQYTRPANLQPKKKKKEKKKKKKEAPRAGIEPAANGLKVQRSAELS